MSAAAAAAATAAAAAAVTSTEAETAASSGKKERPRGHKAVSCLRTKRKEELHYSLLLSLLLLL
jgi:hypothetical protein